MRDIVWSPEEAVVAAALIKGQMSEAELRWLAETAHTQPVGATWVEVGCYRGRSATAVALALPPESHLHLVDPFLGMRRDLEHEALGETKLRQRIEVLRAQRPDMQIMLHVATSLGAVDDFAHDTLHVVFIDGCHETKAVTEDIRAWRPKVRNGGILCGHDVDAAKVQRAVKAELPWAVVVPNTRIFTALIQRLG